MKRKIVNNNNNNKKNRLARQLSAAHTHKSYISKLRVHTKPKNNGNPKPERCSNPWNLDCENFDIALTIVVDKKNHPICRNCWDEIGESDKVWGKG
jgi:hypothetical protein